MCVLNLKNHNCIKELRKVINDQQARIDNLNNELAKHKNDMSLITSDFRLLKVSYNLIHDFSFNLVSF